MISTTKELRLLIRGRVCEQDILLPVVTEGKSSKVKRPRTRGWVAGPGHVDGLVAVATPIRITCGNIAKGKTSNLIIASFNVIGL